MTNTEKAIACLTHSQPATQKQHVNFWMKAIFSIILPMGSVLTHLSEVSHISLLNR